MLKIKPAPSSKTTYSADETKLLGARFSKNLKKGDVVCLVGELGSGKTTFVQGMLDGLGIREFARSSSFVLVNEYASRKFPVYHIDLYRLSVGETFDSGFDEYFSGGGVCVIEWAEKIEKELPSPFTEIRFKYAGENSRKISFSVK
ncbi:MAG: tRNA (adenosine(37)-N6)-threonylcarbamoyltransferase complex ATPase subunit type 1 TsaE [Endomicrobiales bacterium]|nr:tRNA (adenosine(37)-N6)-threonylcarbamoyltransferase complex ATPase subunit type 1 TsaE [Endomicrobiales bacterium]